MGHEPRPRDWAAWMTTTAPSPVRAARPAPRGAVEAPPEAAAPATPPTAAHEHDADGHRSARREATRQRVLDAAREVFAEKGVIGATVEDICERAGFTRGAFYSNFVDKDDVIDALIEREHERLLGHLDASFVDVDREVADAGSLEAAVTSIVDRILRTIPIDRQLSLVQTELEIFAIRRPGQAGRFVEINDRFRSRIATFLEDAVRRYGYELVLDAAAVTDTAIGIAHASVRRALLMGRDADPDELAVAVLPRMLLAFARPVASA